jgi:hypothetical protein
MENSFYDVQQYSFMLIQTHTKRIFDLEPINKNSAIKLKQSTDSLNAHIQALKALNHDPDNVDALLLHVLCRKFDTNTIRKWETEVSRGLTECTINDRVSGGKESNVNRPKMQNY